MKHVFWMKSKNQRHNLHKVDDSLLERNARRRKSTRKDNQKHVKHLQARRWKWEVAASECGT